MLKSFGSRFLVLLAAIFAIQMSVILKGAEDPVGHGWIFAVSIALYLLSLFIPVRSRYH